MFIMRTPALGVTGRLDDRDKRNPALLLEADRPAPVVENEDSPKLTYQVQELGFSNFCEYLLACDSDNNKLQGDLSHISSIMAYLLHLQD
jgi:hypothetical protein